MEMVLLKHLLHNDMNKKQILELVETIYSNDMSILCLNIPENYVLVELPCGTPSNCSIDEFIKGDNSNEESEDENNSD